MPTMTQPRETDRRESHRVMTDEEFDAGLAHVREMLARSREHGERARLLRAERERLERIYFGRRFILIRF